MPDISPGAAVMVLNIKSNTYNIYVTLFFKIH